MRSGSLERDRRGEKEREEEKEGGHSNITEGLIRETEVRIK